MKCKRCDYVWLPIGTRIIPRTGILYMADLGLCIRCDHAKVRLRTATPAEQMEAEIWGERRFEVIKRVDNG